MSEPPDPADPIELIPLGRMLAVRTIEAKLRAGETYEAAGAAVSLSDTTAKKWAALLGFRKCDMAVETLNARIARLAKWTVSLAGLGRLEEAGAIEAETRKLELLRDRLARRIAKDTDRPPYNAASLDLFERVMATSANPDPLEAWRRIAAYYQRLRHRGAIIAPDGQVSWPAGQPLPRRLPKCPTWLPCNPWEVKDEAAWAETAGDALVMF
ncbi:hypothetical protein [Henriciella litoralis]|uniref:hypothetical protein n=1 Tax=Henriciella litoralis TaxID=568102 RepID=UPI000A003094|nr:hypothetical protein [Henriciella litoralis]